MLSPRNTTRFAATNARAAGDGTAAVVTGTSRTLRMSITAAACLRCGLMAKVCLPAVANVTRPMRRGTKFWKCPVSSTTNGSFSPPTSTTTSLPPLPLPQPCQTSTSKVPGVVTVKSQCAQSDGVTQ